MKNVHGIHTIGNRPQNRRARFLSAKHKLNYELRIVYLIGRVQNGGLAVYFLPNRRVLIERCQTSADLIVQRKSQNGTRESV